MKNTFVQIVNKEDVQDLRKLIAVSHYAVERSYLQCYHLPFFIRAIEVRAVHVLSYSFVLSPVLSCCLYYLMTCDMRSLIL